MRVESGALRNACAARTVSVSCGLLCAVQGWSRGFELDLLPEIFKTSYTDFFRYKLLFSRAGPKFKSISDEKLVLWWSSPPKSLAGLRPAQNQVISIGERSEPKKF